MMTARVAEGVRLAREHLELLRRAHPYQLDDTTVSRVIATWRVTRDDLDHLFAGQGRRWRDLTRGTGHQHDVERYCALVAEERAVVEEILTLAAELEAITIDRLLAKSDLEVGIETLLGPSRKPGGRDPDVKPRRPGTE
jgi:hypothetical protein